MEGQSEAYCHYHDSAAMMMMDRNNGPLEQVDLEERDLRIIWKQLVRRIGAQR
jgi:hypothetical protein